MTFVPKLPHKIQYLASFSYLFVKKLCEKTGVEKFVGFGRESDLKKAGLVNAWSVNADFRYGTKNANEFVSVASEFYVDGQENFLKVYGVFIGEEKARTLYNYTRDNIFKGKEYKDYQKINR